MKKPLRAEIDFETRAGYIYYAAVQGHVTTTLDVWDHGRVAADLDNTGNVLAIEVLALDAETLEHARLFATERELEFPAHLEDLIAA